MGSLWRLAGSKITPQIAQVAPNFGNPGEDITRFWVKWSGLVSGVYFVAVLGTTLVDLGWDSNEISMILASFWLNCWWSFCVICLLIYCAHGPFPPTPAAEFQAFRVWLGPDTGPVRGPRPLWQPLNGENASTLEYPTIFNENP